MKAEELKPGMLVYAATCDMENLPLNGTHEDVEAAISVVKYVAVLINENPCLVRTHHSGTSHEGWRADPGQLPPLWTTPEEAKRDAVERMQTECFATQGVNESRVLLLGEWKQHHSGS